MRVVGRIQCTEEEIKQRVYRDVMDWNFFNSILWLMLPLERTEEVHFFTHGTGAPYSLTLLLYCFQKCVLDRECIIMKEVLTCWNETAVPLEEYMGKQTRYSMEECNEMLTRSGNYKNLFHKSYEPLFEQLPYQTSGSDGNDVVQSYVDYMYSVVYRRIATGSVGVDMSRHIVRLRSVGRKCTVSRSKLSR